MTLALPAEATLAAVAAFGLAGSRHPLPAAPLDDDEWEGLVTACVDAGLVGMLAAAADAGALPLRDGQGEELRGSAAQASDRSLAVARAAAVHSARLASAGIDHRVLDGPALVQRVFRTPERRPISSVDVLVAPGAVDAAHVLADGDADLVRVRDEALPAGFGARVRLADVAGPVEVAVPGPEGGGTHLPGLPLDAVCVSACARAAAGPDELIALRDVAQIALVEPLDCALVWARADAWRCTAVVAWAVAQAWQTFDLADKTELSVWASRYQPAPRGPRRVSALRRRLAQVLYRDEL
ncbi:MAG TPA: hypothetical protein VH479_05725 [Acidimicrobiales bacterium]